MSESEIPGRGDRDSSVEGALLGFKDRLNTQKGLAFATFATLTSCDWRAIGSNNVTWPRPSIEYACALISALAPDNRDKVNELETEAEIEETLLMGLGLMKEAGFIPFAEEWVEGKSNSTTGMVRLMKKTTGFS